ncbi:hypothetical protein V498_00599 [Pseudogymnoascus sp. VKM F-4517 (FW-2822)]|nr:hypothetical protein V498_00599 [Pseudogymnoascus sp. VKM F-4517 (FW-2822)]
MLDDNKVLNSIVVAWTLRFNDVLDPDRLHTSLSRLLEIGDWRKLGGRLTRKGTGLEIHVPENFTPADPAIAYSHVSIPTSIEDHPLAKTLPKPTPTASTQRGSDAFREFQCHPDAPASLEDYLNGVPQLSLHITSFDDATLVALSWPHTLMDAMGQQALLHGWSLVLAGRESEVPAFLGAREDALLSAPDEKQEEYRQKRLQGFGMFMFAIRFIWGLLWNRVVETRTIYLPKKAVAELRRQAQDDISGEFVSEGDVLTAWATRAVASSMPPRPITVLHALNLRFRLPSLIEAPGVFVQNMAVSAFALFTPELLRGPLGPIARESRRHLMEQTTEPQLLAILRDLRQNYSPGSDTSFLCGESNALLMPFTNWTRANMCQIADFGAAVVRAGEGDSRSNPPGTMVYHHANSMKQSPTMRNVVVIYGKDHGDNYWLSGFLLPAAWAKIEEEIKRL